MKRGPKTAAGVGPVVPKTVLLDELSIRQLTVVGGGNLSHGIRLAARTAYEKYQRTPDVPAATTSDEAPL